MSRARVYVHVDGRMVPAWGENVQWGPVKANAGTYRGEIVRGESSGKTKAEAAREREARKAA